MSGSTCEQINVELVAYLDGELADAERAPVAAHLATCLVCRREIERLTTIRRWIGSMPRLEPSPEFSSGFWSRLDAEAGASSATRSLPRAVRWGLPALAAAAGLALAFQFSARTSSPPTTAGSASKAAQVPAAGARHPAPINAGAEPRRQGSDEASQVAGARSELPEDLPPDLLEHPELFLRLPVVRRLEKLEHFEEVREKAPDDTVGQVERRRDGVG